MLFDAFLERQGEWLTLVGWHLGQHFFPGKGITGNVALRVRSASI